MVVLVDLTLEGLSADLLNGLPQPVGPRACLGLSLLLVLDEDPLVVVTSQGMLAMRKCLRTHLLPALLVIVEQLSVAPELCHLMMVWYRHPSS